MTSARTCGFGAMQFAAGILIQMWCGLVHARFRIEHLGGLGPVLTNVYWNYAWAYSIVAGLLFITAAIFNRRERVVAYEITIQAGYFLLFVWTGFAVCAIEMAFVPIIHLHGPEY